MTPTTCPVCKHDSVEVQKGYLVCTNCNFYRKRLSFWQSMLAWTNSERSGWWWRVPLILWFVVMLTQHLRDDAFSMDRMANAFNALDFGMHELGHVLFIPFGEFMTIAGGSIFQVLFPMLWVVAFTLKRWYFAACLSIAWIGYNLFDVAAYAGDARDRLLPLATFATDYDSAHDWYQILTRLDMLHADKQIAAGLRVAATVFVLTGIVLASALVLRMAWRAYQTSGTEES